MSPCAKCGGTNFRTEYLGTQSWPSGAMVTEPQKHKEGASFPLGDEWACKEFSHKGERWTVTLCRCQSCSTLKNHIETKEEQA